MSFYYYFLFISWPVERFIIVMVVGKQVVSFAVYFGSPGLPAAQQTNHKLLHAGPGIGLWIMNRLNCVHSFFFRMK